MQRVLTASGTSLPVSRSPPLSSPGLWDGIIFSINQTQRMLKIETLRYKREVKNSSEEFLMLQNRLACYGGISSVFFFSA